MVHLTWEYIHSISQTSGLSSKPPFYSQKESSLRDSRSLFLYCLRIMEKTNQLENFFRKPKWEKWLYYDSRISFSGISYQSSKRWNYSQSWAKEKLDFQKMYDEKVFIIKFDSFTDSPTLKSFSCMSFFTSIDQIKVSIIPMFFYLLFLPLFWDKV